LLVKYILVSFVGGGAILVAAFVLVATLNDRHGGPAPLVALTVDQGSLTPSRIELEKGRLVELQLVNNAQESRVMSTNTDSVEQLPVESNVLDRRNASVPVPYVQIYASAGNAASALVRFTKDGEYELRVETAGRPETLQIATVIVR
jgi:hypothetical protein